ncbi:membrane protein [Vreelandella sulfidaeris]|uniref:Membrane protein n=1 Tax=Vreelandella sulfidaeris TaxID=115553 RepID=A0A455UAF2_9GAMM|nr:membrane protein [Halomonas sulfidaeris]
MANDMSNPDHRDAIKIFARLGYASRGIVYLLVGGLAALAAFGQGGQTEGSRGALERVLAAPFGKILLGLIALGLVCYALWRTIQAIKDADHHGTDAKGIAIRTGLMVSAVTHTLLAFCGNPHLPIWRLFWGLGWGSQGMASWLMQQPFGRWLVGAVGIILIGVGISHVFKGFKAKFHKHFAMPTQTQKWAYPICRFGLVTRGIVFAIVGCFFIIAAYQFNPSEAGGTAEVFTALRSQYTVNGY